MQISNSGDVLRKVVYHKRCTEGGLGVEPPEALGVWGRSPQPLGDFLCFLEKTAILMPLNYISHVFRAI